MRALVTGGAGFIGSHVVERLLEEGVEVIALDDFSTGRPDNVAAFVKRAGFRFQKADISDKKAIRPFFKGVDWVFHLAARADIVPSIQRPDAYYRSNVDGTFSVLEAARFHGVKRFLYAASSSCYGIPDRYPTAESAPVRPQYPYALTKWLGEQTVLHWGQVYRLPVVSLRLFNVYGPRSRTSGTYGAVFGVFLAQKINGKPMTVVGDGKQCRDFTHVSDVARAFVTAARSSVRQEVFNVGSGKPQTVNRLVELLGGARVAIPKRPGEPDRTHADTRKIRNALRWAPEVTFEQGVAALLKRIDYWKKSPVWTPGSIDKATKDWFKFLS